MLRAARQRCPGLPLLDFAWQLFFSRFGWTSAISMAAPPLIAAPSCFTLSADEPFPGVEVQWLHHTASTEGVQLPTGVVPLGGGCVDLLPRVRVGERSACRKLHSCIMPKVSPSSCLRTWRPCKPTSVLCTSLFQSPSASCEVWRLARDEETGFCLVESVDDSDDVEPRPRLLDPSFRVLEGRRHRHPEVVPIGSLATCRP